VRVAIFVRKEKTLTMLSYGKLIAGNEDFVHSVDWFLVELHKYLSVLSISFCITTFNSNVSTTRVDVAPKPFLLLSFHLLSFYTVE